jgi:N-methylhydantoinase A/oxoprolinase/acetone carboxylase beta subunit
MLLGVDVGGTFTDAVLVGEDGTVHTAKVPSTPWEQSLGVLEAVEAVLATAGARARDVERFAHGMTVATSAERAGAHAALTVLSGPAGGVGGALALADLAGEQDVLCFDMGGTSCDVCAIAHGRVPESAERTIAGRPLSLPALDIHTVGAGGGSIAWRDAGGALRVGPASAGADPGPACYGRGGGTADGVGGQPTVTDANAVLGRLRPDAPLAGDLRLDVAAAREAVARLARELDLEPVACAEGIVRVAEAQMLGALRVMSVERGVDPRGFALMAFGGAGPLHAAALARELGIARVLCPRACGVLSALGLAAAPPRWDAARTLMLDLRSLPDERLREERERVIADASRTLAGTPARVRVRHELRYRGQSFELSVDEELAAPSTGEELRAAFAEAHERRYGYSDEDAEVELVNMRASVWGETPPLRPRTAPDTPAPTPELRETIFDGEPVATTIHRGDLGPGTELEGPTLCALAEATVLVPPGWSGTVDDYGTIHLRDSDSHIYKYKYKYKYKYPALPWPSTARPNTVRDGMTALDAIELQVLTGALRSACEEMGVVLIRSAHSANIKERRDASTALFDADGQMVMQAEHIPVHLGAMPAAVAAVLGEAHEAGVSWVLNDPFAGGTHLPDITVITPVFDEDRRSLLGFAASRAHHADVGGRVPGSMPAANRVGAQRLKELAARPWAGGRVSLREATDAVLDYSERRTRACLAALPDDNLTLGDASFSYYETLGGGQGACADADGPSAVHVAMSNTLNTPIEALEREFPLRVTEYALRRGSGGAGRHRGGDGVVRELEALSEMTFSLIAERRRHRPHGAHGGADGACGRDELDGRPLPAKVTGTLARGQRLRIETPGGGGYGHV